ncbi:MAG: DUF1543 domain-containing protein [Chitinophagaceae bacterium]
MARLFMLLIGSSPPGRNIEQHDVFFGIGNSIRDLIPEVIAFWPEAKAKLHFDAWREVINVDGYAVKVVEEPAVTSATQLFFINLGGYKKNEFEEFHYKMLVAAPDKGEAIMQAKKTAFFRHTGFKGANSHIDDKYGVDVDDIFDIRDILPAETKKQYSLVIEPAPGHPEDEIHLGYFKLDTVDKWDIMRSDAASQKSSPE